MKKEDNKERIEKKNVQKMKDKVFDTTNEKERNKYYTKYILAKERVRAREQRVKDNKLEVEGTDKGN
ncbi:hypothetical protein RJD24_03365 [Bacillaceae bacterium IKA-2]|nr:hypothetical protein RJD24_03365 [Bacillaceae bacterium IKA-2]